MRKEDHLRVAAIVSKRLRDHVSFLDSTVIEALKRGSIWPDIRKERRAHHSGREDDIVGYINEARHLFLNNKWDMSARSLGIAFHYTADMMCSHDWEAAVRHQPEPRTLQLLVIKTVHDIHPFLHERFTRGRSFRNTLRNATETCYAVAEITWRTLDELTVEELELIRSMREPKRLYRIQQILYTAGAFLLSLGILPLLILSELNVIPYLSPFVPMLVGILCAVLGYVLFEHKVKKWRSALKWYNLTSAQS